jgi:dTDP-4-dehydrorhamnose 3,5-epimerase
MVEFITLKNKDEVELIEGVILYPLTVNKDDSGILVETLKTDWEGIYGQDRKFAMQYFSVTDPGVIRDEKVWHYHPNQEDRFVVAKGEIVVAIADNRNNSKTKELVNLFYMKFDKDPYNLLIPKQTLHGFMVISKEPGVLLNFPTQLYNPEEEGRIPHDEAGVKFSDGALFSWNIVRSNLQKIND